MGTITNLIRRADLGVALGKGCGTLFFPHDILLDFHVASPETIVLPANQTLDSDSQAYASALELFLDSLESRLRRVWVDISDFVEATNAVNKCELNIDSEVYQTAVISIHYRLVNLRFDTGDINETIRLALLSFASTLFLQWCGVKIRYSYLAQHLKIGLSLLKHNSRAIPSHLTLWMHIVGVISVFDEKEQAQLQPMLIELLRTMNLKSWDEVNLSLESVLWLNTLHDSPAKKIVEGSLFEPKHQNLSHN
jgi:hypothetical protein